MSAQIEWIGGWMRPALMGPWPRREPGAVFVLLLGPLYISLWPRDAEPLAETWFL